MTVYCKFSSHNLKFVLTFLDPGMTGAGRQAKPLVANYCLTERHFQLLLQLLIKKNTTQVTCSA